MDCYSEVEKVGCHVRAETERFVSEKPGFFFNADFYADSEKLLRIVGGVSKQRNLFNDIYTLRCGRW